jgi:hypothetical protein
VLALGWGVTNGNMTDDDNPLATTHTIPRERTRKVFRVRDEQRPQRLLTEIGSARTTDVVDCY